MTMADPIGNILYIRHRGRHSNESNIWSQDLHTWHDNFERATTSLIQDVYLSECEDFMKK